MELKLQEVDTTNSSTPTSLIHGSGPEAREAAIAECAERLSLWHAQDPSSYWQKVVDEETGKIAGAALWNIHEENPFANPHPIEVTWFPEGGTRLFTEQMLRNQNLPRSKVAQKPHLYLFIIFTHPAYRRRGVGQQFMTWGIDKVNEKGFDFYLDATPVGRQLYEANGFEIIEEIVNIPVTENPDEKWKEMEEKVGPFTFWCMCRPANGNKP
ncbi:acyl-CoA N-acyltransferase [Xylariaceae sp. FL0594]|nr:acyl-CoA N-acyltransferase [Xylariaceae sp. FL0594]